MVFHVLDWKQHSALCPLQQLDDPFTMSKFVSLLDYKHHDKLLNEGRFAFVCMWAGNFQAFTKGVIDRFHI